MPRNAGKTIKVSPLGLFHGARQGQRSLAVKIRWAGEAEYEEVPANWIVVSVGEDGIPTSHAPRGATWFLSRPGYDANRVRLEISYARARARMGDARSEDVLREEFRNYAEDVFRRRIEKVNELIEAEIASFERKIRKHERLLESLTQGRV